MSQDRLTHLEETVAHLTKQVEELSDVIARQDIELAQMTHRVQMLMEREAQREAGGTGGVILGDERPPHY
ncbi:Protein SlyX [Aliiroseovarius sp. xm-m-379]|uniref:SlyX family protein n=1 Tax=Aliiroseovarius crassostreae TaxID=154981 RepID=A0A0P7J790_9RHOB|nr:MULTISPECIES: SlyX family protein [Aliiroseovarius]KPN64207.1 SlyX protein [Aliiroseovarius crassostreae]NRP14071.1 Protein SlyX [Aliiroseovarius sp. xm-d-517]NRP23555.1 Protein SlyX [Aliiroseovarius sp. xm-m-379]NRP29198.1 Protein SlyX [Aliiroseovarius sp. xm-m-314]NRP32354.1 Protein SlyX [Aliiroseovarius sp. xm-a-104]